MSAKVLYLRGSAEILTDLLAGLGACGCEIAQVSDFEQLLDSIGKSRPDVVIIDGTSGEAEASRQVVELSSTESLYSVPIVFVGVNAENRISGLSSRFKFLAAIEFPFQLQHAVAGVIHLLERVHGKESKQDSTIESSADPVETPIIDSSHRLPAQEVSAFGGSVLSVAGELANFNDEVLFRAHPKYEEIERALQEITNVDTWLGIHARRVASLSSAIANSLAFGPERDQNVRAVSAMLNWGFRDCWKTKGPYLDLRKVDVFCFGSDELQELLAEGFEKTAKYFKDELDDGLGHRTVSVVAKYFRKGVQDEHKAVVEDAQCAMTVEFVDRACWGKGHWDPRGAHRVMRNLSDGMPFPVGKQVRTAMTRIIGEAICANVTLQNISVPISRETKEKKERDPERRNAIEESERLFGYKNHVEVPIVQLAPGMLLARPVETLDGRVVLRSNLALTPEIINRLWRLAAVRALKSPVVIAREIGY